MSATPKAAMAMVGTGMAPSPMAWFFSTSRMATNGPMALAISFEPWLKAKPEAVTTCIQLKRI